MTPAHVRADVVLERVSWIREMIRSIRALPLSTYDEFVKYCFSRGDAKNAKKMLFKYQKVIFAFSAALREKLTFCKAIKPCPVI